MGSPSSDGVDNGRDDDAEAYGNWAEGAGRYLAGAKMEEARRWRRHVDGSGSEGEVALLLVSLLIVVAITTLRVPSLAKLDH